MAETFSLAFFPSLPHIDYAVTTYSLCLWFDDLSRTPSLKQDITAETLPSLIRRHISSLSVWSGYCPELTLRSPCEIDSNQLPRLGSDSYAQRAIMAKTEHGRRKFQTSHRFCEKDIVCLCGPRLKAGLTRGKWVTHSGRGGTHSIRVLHPLSPMLNRGFIQEPRAAYTKTMQVNSAFMHETQRTDLQCFLITATAVFELDHLDLVLLSDRFETAFNFQLLWIDLYIINVLLNMLSLGSFCPGCPPSFDMGSSTLYWTWYKLLIAEILPLRLQPPAYFGLNTEPMPVLSQIQNEETIGRAAFNYQVCLCTDQPFAFTTAVTMPAPSTPNSVYTLLQLHPETMPASMDGGDQRKAWE
ncbi:hypothetical protein R3P38DRAFT_3354711 [Favolaschia claudopus]|uniref:Uncharacterized protein n=1 Tax=Favolaschia claudopus TaxID=2862362 RepID=A0AAW0BMN4_9AGAR